MARREIRPGVWELRVEIEPDPVPDPVSGRRKRRFLYETFEGGTRAAATAERKLKDRAEAMRSEQRAARAGKTIERPVAERTVRDALEGWWQEAGRYLDAADTPRNHLDTHLLPKLGDVALWRLRGKLRPDNENPDLVSISDFYEQLVATGRVPRQRNNGTMMAAGTLAPSYVGRIHRTLSSGLGYAVERGWIPANPASVARLPKVTPRRSTTPQPADMAAFLAELVEQHHRLYTFALVIGTGARRVEAAPLRWRDFDLEFGELSLKADGLVRVQRDGHEVSELREGETKKRRRRNIEIDDVALDALREHRRRCEAYAAAAKVELPDDAFVFSEAPDGSTPYKVGWASRAFSRYAARARQDLIDDTTGEVIRPGLRLPEGMRLYDVRHFMATVAVGAGHSPVDVAYRMGNSEATVLGKYAKPVPENDRRIAEAVGQAWTATAAPKRQRRPNLKLVPPENDVETG